MRKHKRGVMSSCWTYNQLVRRRSLLNDKNCRSPRQAKSCARGIARVRAEREALVAQRRNLQLIAPVDGLVVARNADPGTTIVAGQAVRTDRPKSLWVNVRFNQIHMRGLAPNLPAQIIFTRKWAKYGRSRAEDRAIGRCSDRGNAGQSGIRPNARASTSNR